MGWKVQLTLITMHECVWYCVREGQVLFKAGYVPLRLYWSLSCYCTFLTLPSACAWLRPLVEQHQVWSCSVGWPDVCHSQKQSDWVACGPWGPPPQPTTEFPFGTPTGAQGGQQRTQEQRQQWPAPLTLLQWKHAKRNRPLPVWAESVFAAPGQKYTRWSEGAKRGACSCSA